MHETGIGVALGNGHVECVQDQFGAQVLGHRPAHHPTRERVQDHREVQPALAGALLGDVSNPQPVRPGRHEVALHQVRCWRGVRVATRGAAAPAAMHALQAVLAHQPGDALAADVDVQAQTQLGVDTRCAIGPTAARVNGADLLGEVGVVQGPPRRRPSGPGVVAGACHTQHAAQSGDLVVWLLRLDQPVAAHR